MHCVQQAPDIFRQTLVRVGRGCQQPRLTLGQTLDAQRPDGVRVRRVFRLLERHGDMALSAEVVDLIRLHLLDHAQHVGGADAAGANLAHIPFAERKHVGTWMPPSYDTELKLVIIGTSWLRLI